MGHTYVCRYHKGSTPHRCRHNVDTAINPQFMFRQRKRQPCWAAMVNIYFSIYAFKITNWFSGVDILDPVKMLVFLVQFSMPIVRMRLETMFTPRSTQVSPNIYNYYYYILTSDR
jgi:hypothetical protein